MSESRQPGGFEPIQFAMGGSFSDATARVQKSQEYRRLVENAAGGLEQSLAMQKAATAEAISRQMNSSIDDSSGVLPTLSLPYDPDFVTVRQIRERYLQVDAWVLRRMAHKGIIIPAIHNTRIEQIRPFAEPYNDSHENPQGYAVIHRDPDHKLTSEDKKTIMEITDFLENTGFTPDEYSGPGAEFLEREDNLEAFIEKLIRETLTIDQLGIELQRNKKGSVVAFHLTDGATIKRATEEGYEGNDAIRFVQEYGGKIRAQYTKNDLLFSYMHPRAELEHAGYGYAPLEQMIDIVTAILFATQYNREQFNSSAMMKGFFSITTGVQGGQLNPEVLKEFQRQWQANFRGIKGAWKTPMLAAPGGVEYKTYGASNKEMEFGKYLDWLVMICSAIYNISVDEMGLRLDRSTPTMGENVAPRIAYSKDRGLRSLLKYIQGILNKIIQENAEWKEYRVVFKGLFKEDKNVAMDVAKKEVDLYSSINRMRKIRGQEPLKDPSGDKELWQAEYPLELLRAPHIYMDLKAKHEPETTAPPAPMGFGGPEGMVAGSDDAGGGATHGNANITPADGAANANQYGERMRTKRPVAFTRSHEDTREIEIEL